MKKNDKDSKAVSLKQNQAAILNDKTAFVIQEAYKTARTNIIFSVAGAANDSCKVIAVTSANPGEGKTTSCINLAITFAQTGARVLLIDGDLRKPRIHQYLGVVKSEGLSTVLSKQKKFDEVVYKSIRESLDVVASGSIPPNPAELLSSDAMGALIDKLKTQYDYIFFDTPPVTVVTDAAALSKYVDGLVLIVREGYTNHESIEHAINLLTIAEAKILGFFVNDIEASSSGYGAYRSKGYGYKYGYRYGYHYGYSYRYGNNPQYGDRAEMSESDFDEEQTVSSNND
jgi:capsular exopolysaccharide synthesis family protein